MKTFILNEDHKIDVIETSNGFNVCFYEYYKSCKKWLQIGPSENYSKDALEFAFDISI